MDATIPLFAAATIGFTHAFEADHLIAVSSLVTKRNQLLLAMKDGIYWGLGHTSTIFIIGLAMIVGKLMISAPVFHYFEAGVGFMLIALGIWRLNKIKVMKKHIEAHKHHHLHDHSDNHKIAYSVGLVHGLAGSGTLVLAVMASMNSVLSGMAYLLVFGLGSVAGMLVASSIFSLPFSKKLSSNYTLQLSLTLFSAVLCIGFGGKVIYENLF
jgi:sulfite exporter TauE/SafE